MIPYRDDVGTEWSEVYGETVSGRVSQIISLKVNEQDFRAVVLEYNSTVSEDVMWIIEAVYPGMANSLSFFP